MSQTFAADRQSLMAESFCQVNFSALRFVEIGASPFIKTCLPQQTTFFSTFIEARPDHLPDRSYCLSMRTFPEFWRSVHDPDLALIVCQPTFFAPWNWQWLTRLIFHHRFLRGQISLTRSLAPQLLRAKLPVRLAIVDMDDIPLINRNSFQCHTYFKRELPSDYWRLFLETAHSNLPDAALPAAKVVC